MVSNVSNSGSVWGLSAKTKACLSNVKSYHRVDHGMHGSSGPQFIGLGYSKEDNSIIFKTSTYVDPKMPPFPNVQKTTSFRHIEVALNLDTGEVKGIDKLFGRSGAIKCPTMRILPFAIGANDVDGDLIYDKVLDANASYKSVKEFMIELLENIRKHDTALFSMGPQFSIPRGEIMGKVPGALELEEIRDFIEDPATEIIQFKTDARERIFKRRDELSKQLNDKSMGLSDEQEKEIEKKMGLLWRFVGLTYGEIGSIEEALEEVRSKIIIQRNK